MPLACLGGSVATGNQPIFFQTALEALKGQVPAEEAAIWLDDLHFVEVEGERVRFSTASHFKKERISRQYLPRLSQLLEEASGQKWRVEILVNSATPPAVPNSPIVNSRPPEPAPQTAGLPAAFHPQNTFDRYVPHANNRLAFECARKICSHLGSISPLYLYGCAGTGKTHLIQAIGRHFLEHHPYLKVRYVRVDQFVTEFIDAIRNRTDRLFRLQYRSLDVFLLDDVQLLSGKTETALEFFHLFNEIYQPGKQLVFTSDVPPGELGGLDERLKSRLASGLIAELEPPAAPARRALLDFYLKEADFDLSEETREFLANRLPPDCRRVIAAVRKLTILRDIHGETIDHAYCQKHLGDCLNPSGGELTPDRLLVSVANYSRHSLGDLKSARRDRGLSQYRQLAMYLLRHHGKVGVNEIARLLGGKSPSAVVQACQAVEQRLREDPLLRKTAETILQGVG